MAAEPELKIPVLTDEVMDYDTEPQTAQENMTSAPLEAARHMPLSDADRAALIAELQTELASRTFALTDQIMRSAFAQMEASVFAQISGRLRTELPEVIDTLLRERLGDDPDY